MQEKKVGIGIIGTGSISGLHLKCVQELNHCEIIAMASSSEERATIARNKFGVKIYSSYQELIQNKAIDAVIIGTHSGNHLEPTLAAAKMGKHVLVEKPIEISAQRADRMIEACKKAAVKLGVIFQNRFSPDYIQLKNAVKAGKLGQLMLGNAYIKWFRDASYYESSAWKGTLNGDGGAALINQGIHTIDLLLDIMGDVDRVFGKVRTVKHKIEGEDLGLALLSFNNGALGTIEASTAIIPGYPERLEIYGTKGSVILEGGKIAAWNLEENQNNNLSKKELNTGSADPLAIDHYLHKAQISDFIDSIQNNKHLLVDGLEGKKSLVLIQGIYASAKQGREISLKE
ncbi:MAG: Gfo/Idh/MocA family oxidoreductase [Saprospiraceae bacterium]